MRFTTDSCADCAQNIIRLEDRTIRRNGLSDVFVKIARISDAGCASIPDQAEALLVEIFVQAAATLQGQKGGKTSAQLCQQVADQHPNLASISGLKLVKGRHPVHPTNTNHHKHSKPTQCNKRLRHVPKTSTASIVELLICCSPLLQVLGDNP